MCIPNTHWNPIHAGRIEVSRAFGDRAFKKQGMSAVPDVQAFQINRRDAFLLLACDGFWGGCCTGASWLRGSAEKCCLCREAGVA